jgi:hypothetical protein
MYQANTQYDGFRTEKVFDNEDGSQYIWLDNDTYWTLIWVDGSESVWIRDTPK